MFLRAIHLFLFSSVERRGGSHRPTSRAFRAPAEQCGLTQVRLCSGSEK